VTIHTRERGNIEGSPAILLQSITCDDNCDPAADIREAEFGTEDLEFLLRATHSPEGRGRTYTITYSVRFNGGRVTTATTTALVPHNRQP